MERWGKTLMCGKNGQPATASSSTGKTSPVHLAYVQNSVLLLFLQCALCVLWIQGFRGVLHLVVSNLRPLKCLKLYKKVLIMISRGLKFGDGKTRIAVWLNVTIKLQKAMISWNKHERCTIRCCAALCTAVTGETVIFLPNAPPACREWMWNFNKTVVLFKIQTHAKIAPCFYPANTQSFKCELVDR